MTLTRCLLAQLHQPHSPARQGKGTSSSSSSEHTPHSLHACTRRCQNRSCLRCLAHGAWDSPPHLRHASRSIAKCDPLRAPCTLGASYAPALLHVVLPQRWSHQGQQPSTCANQLNQHPLCSRPVAPFTHRHCSPCCPWPLCRSSSDSQATMTALPRGRLPAMATAAVATLLVLLACPLQASAQDR